MKRNAVIAKLIVFIAVLSVSWLNGRKADRVSSGMSDR